MFASDSVRSRDSKAAFKTKPLNDCNADVDDDVQWMMNEVTG